MLTEGIVLSCSGARARAGARDRRHARAGAAWTRSAFRCCAGCSIDGDGARLHAGDRDRHRHRLRAGAGASGAQRRAARRAEGRDSRLHRRTRRAWVRNALVVSEIAFACVLLVGAGLLIRSLIRVLDVDMGFEPARAATIRVDPDARVRRRASSGTRTSTRCCAASRRFPASRRAAITDALPLGRNRTWGARAKGVTYERGRAPVGVRARGQRRLSRGDGHSAAWPAATFAEQRHARRASRSS